MPPVIGTSYLDELRQQAEELLTEKAYQGTDAALNLRELIHELDVHEVELQMQNMELRRTQEALLATQQEYEELYEFAPFGYLTLNPKGIITRANLGACGLLRATRGQLLRSSMSPFLDKDSQEPYVMARKRARESDASVNVELKLAERSGPDAWIEAELRRDCNADGMVTQFRLAFLDVSVRKRADIEASELKNTLEAALGSMSDGIFICDAQGRPVHVNKAWKVLHRRTDEIYGDLRVKQETGDLIISLASGFPVPASQQPVVRALRGETARNQEYHFKYGPSGESWIACYNLAPIRDADGGIVGAAVTGRDITSSRQHELALVRAAHHDPLTDLPNRLLLSDRLGQAVALADRTGNGLAVCYLDLDGFKELNDKYGHAAGDKCLKAVASTLRQVLRTHDSVARIGGDEFVLLLSEVLTQEDVNHLLSRLLAQLRRPLDICEDRPQLSASIGVTMYPADQAVGDTLFRHADQALYRAKELGGDQYQFFDVRSRHLARQSRRFSLDLTQAIEREELVLYYQPQVDLLSRKLIGVEALIRWQHPRRGLLGPDEFLQHIEDSALEIATGDWVISNVITQLSLWNAMGLRLRGGINVGIGQLTAPDFVSGLQRRLEAFRDVDPGQLEIEILESVAVSDFEKTQEIINECRAFGVRFALDDFGTGYSSLACFRELAVDQLKIDQGFVRDMRDDNGDVRIVESVVKLAHAFDREAIAEGVETIEHVALLTWLGCRFGQGNGIARPMPADDLPAWAACWNQERYWPRIDGARSRPDIALMAAAQDHLCWFDGVVRIIESGDGHAATFADRHECSFGRWLRSSGATLFGQLPDYPDIVEAHDAIHATACDLLDREAAGISPRAKVHLPALHTMQERFTARLACLID